MFCMICCLLIFRATTTSYFIPKLIICALQYQVIHETAPNYMTQFYGKQVGEATEESPGGFGVSMPYNF